MYLLGILKNIKTVQTYFNKDKIEKQSYLIRNHRYWSPPPFLIVLPNPSIETKTRQFKEPQIPQVLIFLVLLQNCH